MREPIERGAGESLVAEHFGPVLERPNILRLNSLPIQRPRRLLRLPQPHCWS